MLRRLESLKRDTWSNFLRIVSSAERRTIWLKNDLWSYRLKKHTLHVRFGVHFLLDENSTNTIENARNCKRIVDHHGISTLKIVTNEFHMPRAHLIFKTVFRNSPVRLLPLHAPNGLAFDAQYRYRKYNVIIEKMLPLSPWCSLLQDALRSTLWFEWVDSEGAPGLGMERRLWTRETQGIQKLSNKLALAIWKVQNSSELLAIKKKWWCQC